MSLKQKEKMLAKNFKVLSQEYKQGFEDAIRITIDVLGKNALDGLMMVNKNNADLNEQIH